MTKKRDERRKLNLRRERLRQLTTDQARQVAGGNTWGAIDDINGRNPGTRCCVDDG
jgi:hypothetical protein